MTDLGSHTLRGLPRPERVVQLCHPDVRKEFPPLRTLGCWLRAASSGQLTSFIGRESKSSRCAGSSPTTVW